jgi:hypothetical protein
MKVSKTMLAIAAAVTVAGFVCGQAQATQIHGMLNIAGTAKFNTTSLATATSVVSFSSVTVGGGNTGDFVGIATGTAVAMASPYIFNPSTGTPMLWSVGGFTFDLQSSTINTQNSNFLTISGTGIITGPGFDPTPGVWAFTSQNASGRPHDTFTFSATTEAVPNVPDGGMTVTLLGAALVGLAGLRAKFGKV